MKVAYVLFIRNKMPLAAHVEKAVRSALAQTYAPLEIVLSDQGSTDGTRELLARLAAEYRGPHTVRVLDCPHTENTGMAGMNAHLEWLHDEIDCDIFIPASGDDIAAPARTAKIVAAFEETGADMVGTAMLFEDPSGVNPPSRSSYARTGWVNMGDLVTQKVGGSCAPAWRRALWQRVRPIPQLAGCDVWLPPLACALGGVWYINEPLYTYQAHADVNNAGLEGVLKALPQAEHQPVLEHIQFQTAAAWNWTLRTMNRLGVGDTEERNIVTQVAMQRFVAWLDVRTQMTLAQIAPKPFPF